MLTATFSPYGMIWVEEKSCVVSMSELLQQICFHKTVLIGEKDQKLTQALV